MVNPDFIGNPDIKVARYFEEGDAVVTEGTVNDPDRYTESVLH